jgi:hypothetical protein
MPGLGRSNLVVATGTASDNVNTLGGEKIDKFP